MTVADDLRSALRRAGRPMTLVHRVGTGSTTFTAVLPGVSTGYKPNELVGLVVQGDRRIRVSALDLADEAAAGRWPVGVPAPKKPDTFDGGIVHGVGPLHDGAELVGWVVWVRG